MARFDLAYPYTKKYEGGYVNNPNDYGGETYAGISRVKNPNEKDIWTAIDFYKKTSGGKIQRGTIFPGMTGMVENFYNRIWDKNRLSEIHDQGLATNIFDYIVHKSGLNGLGAQRQIQRLVNVDDDGIFGRITIAAINQQNPQTLINKILTLRRNELTAQAENESQKEFLKGWLSRLNLLATAFLTKTGGGAMSFLLIIFILILLLTL